MSLWLTLILGPVSWVAMLLINLPLLVLGWAIIPPLAYTGAYHTRQSKFYNKQIVAWNNKWVNLIYGNEEDGILNGRQYHNWGADWKQIVYWTALRNPTNNLRFAGAPFSFILDKSKVKYVGSFGNKLSAYDSPTPQWFIAWHGPYSCFFWQFFLNGKLRRFWIGWAIYPTDINGVTTYRKYGVGFKIQFKPVK